MYYKESVARSFSSAAAYYDMQAIFQKQVAYDLVQKIMLQYPLALPIVALDVGAGTGFVSDYLLQHHNMQQLVSADIAFGMVDFLKNKKQENLVVCADVDHLPFDEHYFDLVTAGLLIQWSTDLSRTLSSLQRVLKKKGLFAFSTLLTGTLCELKSSFEKMDQVAPIHPLLTQQQLQISLAEKFKSVELVTQRYVLHYQNVKDILQKIKRIGIKNHNPQRMRGLAGKNRLNQLMQNYEEFRNEEGLLPVTYQVCFGLVRNE